METTANSPPTEKKRHLLSLLKKRAPLALALSGGVDSGLLLAVAAESLPDQVIAMTSICPFHPRREMEAAAGLAKQLGIRHIRVKSHRLTDLALTDNTAERCYLCKKMMWAECRAAVFPLGFACLADGVNADDLDKYRPGLAAGREMGVVSLLAECGFRKNEVRGLAKTMGLPFWDKPANSCLATRIPQGVRITPERLQMIEQAESLLHKRGVRQCRVRYSGDAARIEISENEIKKITDAPQWRIIRDEYRHLGFSQITIAPCLGDNGTPVDKEPLYGKTGN